MIRNSRKSKSVSVVKIVPAAGQPAKAVAIKAPSAPAAPSAGRVSLELLKPGAKSVFVAGSFNSWQPEQTPLVETGGGRWVGDVSVRPGRHEYLFVVDGHWVPDPKAVETVQNPFGGVNSVLTVTE